MELDQLVQLRLEAIQTFNELRHRVAPEREHFGLDYQQRAAWLIPVAFARMRRRTEKYLQALAVREMQVYRRE
jgi:hypothetical protein